MTAIAAQSAQEWLVDKIAHRLGVEPAAVSVTTFFDDFDLDSTEALILAGELEAWLGFEIATTALWYHPTIEQLAAYLAEESGNHATGQ
jgi:acyl carrier protein